MKIINLDQMKNMSIDDIIGLYRDGYRLEEYTSIVPLSQFSNINVLQGSAVDPVVNFGKVTVSTGYNDTATSIVLNTGDGSKLPNPSTSGAFNLVWWNFTDYPDPSDDPNKEIIRCTARSTDTLTVTRGQEGISASTKNTAGKTYKMVLTVTAKTISDIQTDAQNKVNTHASVTLSVHNFDSSGNAPPQTHGKTKHDSTTVDGGAALGLATQIPAHGSAQHTGTIGTTSNVTEGTNLYYTDARARASISGTTPITYNSSSGAVGINQAGSSTSGYLSSTDWNTFNGKASPLGYTPVNKAGDTMSGSLTVNAQYASAKYAGSVSVNWNNGNVQSMTLANGGNSFSFSNPISGGRYMLLLTSGGASTTATWPGSVKWPNATAPTLSTTSGHIDIVTFVYDGTNYYGNISFNYY